MEKIKRIPLSFCLKARLLVQTIVIFPSSSRQSSLDEEPQLPALFSQHCACRCLSGTHLCRNHVVVWFVFLLYTLSEVFLQCSSVAFSVFSLLGSQGVCDTDCSSVSLGAVQVISSLIWVHLSGPCEVLLILLFGYGFERETGVMMSL